MRTDVGVTADVAVCSDCAGDPAAPQGMLWERGALGVLCPSEPPVCVPRQGLSRFGLMERGFRCDGASHITTVVH